MCRYVTRQMLAGCLIAFILFCPLRSFGAEVAVVVSSASPVQSLTESQVADLFLGRSSTFPGGVAAVPVDQSEGAEIREVFYLKLLRKTPAQVKSYWMRLVFTGKGEPPATLPNIESIKRTLAANPNVVTYVDRSNVDSSLKVLLLLP